MYLGEIINMFEGLLFSKVIEAKVTEEGFDIVTDEGIYNNLLKGFVERINTELYCEDKIVDIEITDWLIEATGNNVVYHFYDRYFFDSCGEEHRKAEFQRRKAEEEERLERKLRGEDFAVEPIEFLDRKTAYRNEDSSELSASVNEDSSRIQENPKQLSEEELSAREERAEKKRQRQEKVHAIMPTLPPTVQASLKDVDLATQAIYVEMLDRGTSNAESIANEVDMSAAAVRTSMAKLRKVGLAERKGSRKTGTYKLIEQPAFNYTKKCESCDLYKRYSSPSDCALCHETDLF